MNELELIALIVKASIISFVWLLLGSIVMYGLLDLEEPLKWQQYVIACIFRGPIYTIAMLICGLIKLIRILYNL